MYKEKNISMNFLCLACVYVYIIGSVRDKCPGFCKFLRLSKSGFATFSNSAGCQKVTSTLSKQPTDHYGDGNKNNVYLKITDNLCHSVHVIIMLDGS